MQSPPFPESGLSAAEQSVLADARQVVVQVNGLSGLSSGDRGYVNPAWVTLYQSGFDSPAGNPNRTRLASESRDATDLLLLWRVSGALVYSDRMLPSQVLNAQCVIRFTPDFWALAPGPDRDSRIAHETYHCFQFKHSNTWNPTSDFWFFEGGAQVVGDYFGDRGIPAGGGGRGVSQVGQRNLNKYVAVKKPLFNRDYDAAAFFRHVADKSSFGDLLRRLQDLYAYKVANPGDIDSERLLRVVIPADEKEQVEETWATRLWRARAPYPDFGEDWTFEYFNRGPAEEFETQKVDFTGDDVSDREITLYPAQPEVIEVTVQPNVYYRVTVENASARSIGNRPGGGDPLQHRYAEEETFTFCVGESCQCPPGSRAYEFEVLDDPGGDKPHLIIAATATTATDTGSIGFGKVKIELMEEPPCCTGGLQPRENFPDITGSWRFRDGRLQAWADRIRNVRVEVYEDRREADCTRARVDNNANISISRGGAFVADYGLTKVEFSCRYVADRGTNEVERKWEYEWWGQYGACMTLQEADSFRAGYPERTNPVMRPLVESWFTQIGLFDAYNRGLDEDERPVSASPYQPSATANAFWYDVSSNVQYRQTVTINDNDGEDVDVVDECTINLTSPGCTQGAPRMIGEYMFFAPSNSPSWFDVFGGDGVATGLYAPLPHYFQEFSGGAVQYPNLVR